MIKHNLSAFEWQSLCRDLLGHKSPCRCHVDAASVDAYEGKGVTSCVAANSRGNGQVRFVLVWEGRGDN